MPLVDWVVLAGTVASGLVSVGVIVGSIVDWVTNGWVRGLVQRWMGITQLRQDHRSTQAFIIDVGDGVNELAEVVCNEHDIPEDDRPARVATNRYEWLLDDEEDLSRGDFRTGDD